MRAPWSWGMVLGTWTGVLVLMLCSHRVRTNA